MRTGDPSVARLEAEVLLAFVLGISRGHLLARDGVDVEAEGRFAVLVDERVGTGRPVAYLIGSREFWGLDLLVDERVLVPRPETELLIERLAQLLAEGRVPRGPLVDRGTGSGCLAVAASAWRPVLALDVEADALQVARANAARHVARGRVQCVQGDGLASIAPASVAAVLANPPYITASEFAALDEDVRVHEPRRALVADEESVPALYTRLLAESLVVLLPGGWWLSEVGAGQAEQVAALARAAGLAEVAIRPDLAGHGRVVEGRRPEPSPPPG